MNSEFFLTLPSNTQLPENKTGSFKVRLPQTIVLDGDWEVALVEIMYPHTWYNINGHDLLEYDSRYPGEYPNSFRVRSKQMGEIYALVPPGYYGTITGMLKAIELGLRHQGKHAWRYFIENAYRTEDFKQREVAELEAELKKAEQDKNQKLRQYQDKLNQSRNRGKRSASESSASEGQMKRARTPRTVDAVLPVGAVNSLIEGHEADIKEDMAAYHEKIKENKKWENEIEILTDNYEKEKIQLLSKIDGKKQDLEDWTERVNRVKASEDVPDVDGIQFSFNETLYRVNIELDTKKIDYVELSPHLAVVLRYNSGLESVILDKSQNQAKYQPGLTGGFYAMYVYCNIVENQIVGNYRVPLLRSVHVEGNHGDIRDKIFHSPHYVPVVAREIDLIEIDIKGDNDQSIEFVSGKVVVKLHFRKKRLFY